MAKDTKVQTVVAECEVVTNDETITVRHFDKAWGIGLGLAKISMPVRISFVRFVRID